MIPNNCCFTFKTINIKDEETIKKETKSKRITAIFFIIYKLLWPLRLEEENKYKGIVNY